MRKVYYPALIFLTITVLSAKSQYTAAYLDPIVPVETRIDDLISKLTLEEKVSQMLFNSPAIPRLNIPEYNWWNECLHGVARSGVAQHGSSLVRLYAHITDSTPASTRDLKAGR